MTILWKEDCTLYKFKDDNFYGKLVNHNTNRFEKLLHTKLNNNIVEINYSWIDPIRMRDKIIAREQSTITFWIFLNEQVLCCFSNSESSITYALTKLTQNFNAVFSKLEAYYMWENTFLNGTKFFADLISVHIKKTPTPSDEREIIKIPLKNTSFQEINHYIQKEILTNLTFKYNSQTFYLDVASVLSFPDTSKEDKIFEVISKVVEEMDKTHA